MLELQGTMGSMKIIAKHCVSRHMIFWAQQSLAQQTDWQHRARRSAHAREHLLGLQWQTFSAELAKLEVTITEKKLLSKALTMSAAKMDQQDVETFDSLRKQEGFRQKQSIAMRRSAVGTALAYFVRPKAKSDAVWARPEVDMPEWAKPFIRHRSMFMGSALVVQRANGVRDFWKWSSPSNPPNYIWGCARCAQCLCHLRTMLLRRCCRST